MEAEKTRDYIKSFCDTNYTCQIKESSKELDELERLAEIGRATERFLEAYDIDYDIDYYIGCSGGRIESVEELLDWAKEQNE